MIDVAADQKLEDEIEVTSEMVDAGVEALRELSETYPEHLLAEQVYIAMARLIPKPDFLAVRT
ncbi:MAG: hypothetical protein KF686_01135 [Ramlibacter sp.]|nr:hypothetical protein [Ramlibacter sp.]